MRMVKIHIKYEYFVRASPDSLHARDIRMNLMKNKFHETTRNSIKGIIVRTILPEIAGCIRETLYHILLQLTKQTQLSEVNITIRLAHITYLYL